jgi:hypothetical protein
LKGYEGIEQVSWFHASCKECPLQPFLRTDQLKFVVYYFFLLRIGSGQIRIGSRNRSGYRKDRSEFRTGSGFRMTPKGNSGFSSVSYTDPDWILNQVIGSGYGSRRAKITHKIRKKVKKFHVLKCWMFSFDVLRLLL